MDLSLPPEKAVESNRSHGELCDLAFVHQFVASPRKSCGNNPNVWTICQILGRWEEIVQGQLV